jgi:hypothetical protein
MPITLNEWFSMKNGRSSFLPQLPDDANLVFCHYELIHENILSSIEKNFARKKPIKMLIHGDWGVGKTHTTYHICWWLKTNAEDYPAYPVVIEIGDISRKSRFDEIVRPFLDKLGIDFLIRLVHDYRGKEQNVSQALRAKGVASHIAEALNKMLLSSPGQAPVELVSQTFEYLKGRKIAGAASLGLGQPLEQSQEFIDILTAIGEMYQSVNKGTRILFIADEAAKLENVEVDEAVQSHWVTANKLIFDDRNQSFGFVYTVSGKQQRELPRAIWEPQIQNRLGQNVFRLDTLATKDVESYLAKMLEAFIDWQRVDQLASDGTIPADQYDRPSYPFTPEARERFLDYFNRAQENAKPRDISERLDDLAFVTLKRKERVITASVLESKDM